MVKTIQSSGRNIPRIAILWQRLPPYARACIKKLSAVLGGDLWYASAGEAPEYGGIPAAGDRPVTVYRLDSGSRHTAKKILEELDAFKPDVLVVSGWSIGVLRLVARRLKSQGVLTVCAADTPWTGSARQRIRCMVGKFFIHRIYDVMWVPGSRAAQLARRAGFRKPFIWRDLLSADTGIFSATTAQRLHDARAKKAWPRRILFVGRLSPEKNVERLIEAYRIYRARVRDPWDLVLAGDGELRGAAQGVRGVNHLGWISQGKVAALMAESGCLILPSTWDPWAIVVHEAACSGLPVLLSRDVGSAEELLRHDHNGRLFNSRDMSDIVNTLIWMTGHPEPWSLGEVSHEISRRFSPGSWAGYLIDKSREAFHATVNHAG